MNGPVIVLAFLGAVLVGLVAQMIVPNNPTGRTMAFVAFMAALFPVARLVWLAEAPAWRYWAGAGLGALVGWTLDTWRTAQSWSAQTNLVVGIAVVAALTAGLLYACWKSAHEKRQPLA